jgi:hypothetical protein
MQSQIDINISGFSLSIMMLYLIASNLLFRFSINSKLIALPIYYVWPNLENTFPK